MLSISKPAEKCSYRSTKKQIRLKQKDWSKTGVPATSTRYSDHLSSQFLITASTFPYSYKNSSAEHIHTLPTCLTLIITLTHIVKHTHTHTHTHSLMHTETCIKSVNMFGWGIFGAIWNGRGAAQELSAEVIRAPGWGSWNPPLFDQSFCFIHISLFCAPIGAFFRWYPPFPCYTKDFTCRSEVNLNPCIPITNQDFEK